MTVVINGTTGIDTGTGSLIAADSTTPTYLDLFEDTDNGSNYVRLIAPTSVASNKTITLPDATGTMVVGSAAVSAVGQIPFSTDGSSYTPTAKIVSGTAVTLTTQTNVDFSIPSWVKRITVMFSGVSTSSTTPIRIQLGTGVTPTYVNSGYAASAGALGNTNTTAITAFTNGFPVSRTSVAADTISSIMTIVNITGTLWVATANTRTSGNTVFAVTSGQVDAGAVVTALRATQDGIDTFDAGTINILYE